jgi:uncharacterized membrane protein YeaQ/YmgE (transglycosylase-associated protein family)
MSATFGEILVWIIVGGLSGSLLGMLAKRSKEGYGRFRNVLLGMAGALVGGVLFNVLEIDLGLGDLSISFEDLIAAFVGSVVVLAIVWSVKRYKRSKQGNQ